MTTTTARTFSLPRLLALGAVVLGTGVAAVAAVSRLRPPADLVAESEDYEAENAAMLVVDED